MEIHRQLKKEVYRIWQQQKQNISTLLTLLTVLIAVQQKQLNLEYIADHPKGKKPRKFRCTNARNVVIVLSQIKRGEVEMTKLNGIRIGQTHKHKLNTPECVYLKRINSLVYKIKISKCLICKKEVIIRSLWK